MEEEKREIKALPNKQLIMDIGKIKNTVNVNVNMLLYKKWKIFLYNYKHYTSVS